MRLLSFILFLGLMGLSISGNPRVLLFDSFFQWQTATWTITKQGANGSNSFDAPVNSNSRGLYMQLTDEIINSNEDFIDEVAYNETTGGQNAYVFDFQLMDCHFNDVSTWLAKKFQFTMRTYSKEGRITGNYSLLASYQMGSKLFGGLDLDSILQTLSIKCWARKAYFAEQILEIALALETKAIEAEQMAEALKNQDEADAAELQKLIDLAKKIAQNQTNQINTTDLNNSAQDDISNDEKKHVRTNYTVVANFNSGFGYGIFITGQDALLGAWQTAFRMTPSSDGNSWSYRLPEGIANGGVFKTVVARWDEGTNFTMYDAFINGRPVYWENAQGSQGNKVMSFNDFVMSYNPTYPSYN